MSLATLAHSGLGTTELQVLTGVKIKYSLTLAQALRYVFWKASGYSTEASLRFAKDKHDTQAKNGVPGIAKSTFRDTCIDTI